MYSVHWGINLPSKTPPALSCQAPPLKSSNCPRHPFLAISPIFLLKDCHHPLKKVTPSFPATLL